MDAGLLTETQLQLYYCSLCLIKKQYTVLISVWHVNVIAHSYISWRLLLAHSHVHKYEILPGRRWTSPGWGWRLVWRCGRTCWLDFLLVLVVLKLIFDIEPLLTVTPTSSIKTTGRERASGATKLCWGYELLAFSDWCSDVYAVLWLNIIFVSHIQRGVVYHRLLFQWLFTFWRAIGRFGWNVNLTFLWEFFIHFIHALDYCM